MSEEAILNHTLKDKKKHRGINLKKIPAFILDLTLAYILGAIIIFCVGLILYRSLVVLGQVVPSTREGILLFFKMKIFDFLLGTAFVILIFLYFKIFPKLIGKTLGERIFRI